ncbi:arginase family protein [Vibrio chagasii]|nr:arginase family protein [Vibrio chagasii]
MIHFDAHTDTYNQGSRYDHGTMFYHASRTLISPEHSVRDQHSYEYKQKVMTLST